MRSVLVAVLALIGSVACHATTCRDGCYGEQSDCLDEADSFAEEDQCRGMYEQCQLQCDDDELELAPGDAG